MYSVHGWSDSDIAYAEEHCTMLDHGTNWAICGAFASDGVLWLYPASANDIFPLAQWKKIRKYITTFDNVVIPMDRNQDKVMRVAKKYNGYLQDNMFLFGDQLKGLQYYEGNNKWLGLKN